MTRQERMKLDELIEDTVVLYTTAPVYYDGCTIESSEVGRTASGKPVRRVVVLEEDAEWHRGRYGSGNHMTLTTPEWRRHVELGLSTLDPTASAIAGDCA
jgi:hypothetical protein